MPLSAALFVAAGLIVVAIAIGCALRHVEGRARSAPSPDAVIEPGLIPPEKFGARATLVQFSTEFCSRCPQAHRMLASWAQERHGVVHVDIDLTHRADLATRYGILQTPTTIVTDVSGRVRARINGIPRADALQNALATATTAHGATTSSSPSFVAKEIA